MKPAPLKLFLTGDPGCGKTTAIRRVVERLRGRLPMRGFVTEEITGEQGRAGFQGRTLDGRTFLLADRQESSDLRVGPYHVVLDGLEQIGVPALRPAADTGLVILDEVGKMESFSPAFRECVEDLLAGDTPVLATVASHGVGFVKRVRRDSRIELLRMRRRARDAVVGDIVRRLTAANVIPQAARPASSAAGRNDRP